MEQVLIYQTLLKNVYLASLKSNVENYVLINLKMYQVM